MTESGLGTRKRGQAGWLGVSLFALLLVVLSGCAADTSCVQNKQYVHAETFPMLQDPPGLKVPKPDPNMQIPAVSGGPVVAYKTAPQGVDPSSPIARCLTTPPSLSN